MKKKDLYKIVKKELKEQLRGRDNEIEPLDNEPMDFDDLVPDDSTPPPDPGGTDYGPLLEYYCTADSTAKYAGTLDIGDKFCCDGDSNNGAQSSTGGFAGGVDSTIAGSPSGDYCLGVHQQQSLTPPPLNDCSAGTLAADWAAWVGFSQWPYGGNIVTDTGVATANTPNTAFGPYSSLQAAKMNCCPDKNNLATNPNGTCRGCRVSGNDNYGSGYTMSANNSDCITYDCDLSANPPYVAVTGLGGTHANAAAAAAACISTTVYGCTTVGDCNEDTNATANDPLYCVGVPNGACESCSTDPSAVDPTYNPSGNIVVSSVGATGGCSCDVPGSGNYDPSNLGCPDQNNDPDPGNTGCCTPPSTTACMQIKAVECNSHQIPGQQSVHITPCATIDGQTPQQGDSYMTGNGVPYLIYLPDGSEFVNHSGYIDYEVIEVNMPDAPAGQPAPTPVNLQGGMCPRPTTTTPKDPRTKHQTDGQFANPFSPQFDTELTHYHDNPAFKDEEEIISEIQTSKKLRALFEEEFSLNEEKKLRNLIKKVLKKKIK